MTARGRWWTSLLVIAFGCSSRDVPVGPPGLRDSAGNPITAAPVAARGDVKDASKRAAPRAPVFDGPAGFAPTGDLGTFPIPGAPSPSAEAAFGGDSGAGDAGADTPAAERDLRAEVGALLDPRGACLDFGAAAAGSGRLVLSASVTLLPGGTLMRATVNAPGQPSEARACLEQRLLSARLPGPIPGAPRNVDATFIVEVTRGRTTPEPRPTLVPRPNNPDIARPDPGEVAKPEPGDVAGAP